MFKAETHLDWKMEEENPAPQNKTRIQRRSDCVSYTAPDISAPDWILYTCTILKMFVLFYAERSNDLYKWIDIYFDNHIINVIENGYREPFEQVPSSGNLNNESTRDNAYATVVYEGIEKFIEKCPRNTGV